MTHLRFLAVISVFIAALLPTIAVAQTGEIPDFGDPRCRTINIEVTICDEYRSFSITQAAEYLVDGLNSLFGDDSSAEVTDVTIQDDDATELEASDSKRP